MKIILLLGIEFNINVFIFFSLLKSIRYPLKYQPKVNILQVNSYSLPAFIINNIINTITFTFGGKSKFHYNAITKLSALNEVWFVKCIMQIYMHIMFCNRGCVKIFNTNKLKFKIIARISSFLQVFRRQILILYFLRDIL